MKRREFIRLLSGAAVAWPFAAYAQQPGKMYRVAFVSAGPPVSEMVGPNPINPGARALVHGLKALGYIEGKNMVLVWRSVEGRYERLREIMREVVSINVDVIVTGTNVATRAAKEVTQTIPIATLSPNPVEEGLIQSLARPGGNITGLMIDTGPEFVAKRVQLLKELLPNMSRMAILHSIEVPPESLQRLEAASRELAIKMLVAEHTPTDYANAFALIVRERADALLVPSTGANFGNRRMIAEFAATNRIPAMYGRREFVTAGGLIAYGVGVADLYRDLAAYIDRILKGAKPADLPVQQPTKFPLTVNLKTAKALDLEIPPLLLARADEVIE